MMKQTILLFFAALCGIASLAAQDLIVKTDAVRIEARVTEITPDAVRYKRFSNPDGPTYVLPVVQIDYIRYANGEKESFSKSPRVIPATPLTPATPAVSTIPATPLTPATPAASTIPATPLTPATPAASVIPATPLTPATGQPAGKYVLKKYKIGELYDADGVKGIVCRVSEDGQHGLVLSLDQIMIQWSVFRKPELRVAGTDDRTDGAANMEKLAVYLAANNLSWDDFPAFKWCRERGEGWYLPAIDELLTIGHNYNGGTRMNNNRKARNLFNDALKANGGPRMDRLVYYFCSTEMDEKNAYTTHMDLQPPYVIEIPKYNRFLVRAVRKF